MAAGGRARQVLTDLTITALTSYRWGAFGGTTSSDIRYSATAISDTGFTEIDRDFYCYASGTRDISSTAAAPVLFIPDGMFTDATQARVRHAVGSDPTGGTAGSWAALSGKSQSALQLSITGLTANTRYAYQFEIGDASGNVLWTSDPYSLKTLAAAGTEAPFKFNFTSCYVGTSPCHPFRDDQYILDAVDGDYMGTIHLGDVGYEYSLYADYHVGHPYETSDDFELKLREYFSDAVCEQLQRAGPYIVQADDHEVIDQAEANMRTGGTLASTLVNGTAYDKSSGSYGASTTLNDVYSAGMGVVDAWFPWLDLPSDDGGRRAYYKHRVHGCVEIIHMDTRHTRKVASNLYMSAQQLAWVKAQVDAIASTTNLVLFVSQSAVAQHSTKFYGSNANSEGWERLAPTQFAEFKNYLAANMPEGTNFAFVNGDDHLIYLLHNEFTGLSPECLGEVRCSGGAVNYLPSSATDISEAIWGFDPDDLTATKPFVRGSGVLVEVTGDCDAVDLSCYTDGSARSHNLFTAAAPTISTNAEQSNTSGEALAIALAADQDGLTWTIEGGADAAEYEISGSTLRWASDGTKDFSSPADSDTNNTYVVTVRGTNRWGAVH